MTDYRLYLRDGSTYIMNARENIVSAIVCFIDTFAPHYKFSDIIKIEEI